MKKIFGIFLALIILLTNCLQAFAGSIPEDLMDDDNAKLYIGIIEDFSEEEIPSAPCVKVISANIKSIEKIKGDVQIGKTYFYENANIYTKLEEGKEYLIADIDENNIYAYDIKSKTDKKLKLVNSDKYDMVKRLEDYINEGAYSLAEKERSELGLKKSFSEYIGATLQTAESVYYNIGGKKYEVDKEKFFEKADKIIIKNVKDDMLKQTDYDDNSWQENMIYITVDMKKDDKKQDDYLMNSYACVSKYGEVDRCSLYMSRLPCKDYQMEIEDVASLYKLLPISVSANYVEPSLEEKAELNKTMYLIILFFCCEFVVLIITAYYFVRKKSRR